MDPWVQAGAAEIARRAVRELEALVAVSSPSGDVHGAEECASVCAALLPDEAQIERIPCSSPDHAPDLLARLIGTGTKRILLLGHLDTVVAHAEHRPLTRDGEKLVGSGSVDMKGGVVLSLGAMRLLARRPRTTPRSRCSSSATRSGARARSPTSAASPAGTPACASRAASAPPTATTAWSCAARRPARSRSSRTGAPRTPAPRQTAGATRCSRSASPPARWPTAHDPDGPAHLTAVPTVLHAGEAFNVVPGRGELYCDLRADEIDAIEAVLAAVPAEHEGVRLEAELIRRWPGMHSEEATAGLLARASAALGRPIVPRARGGASDASHMAAALPVTVDGLGPRGGAAHNPDEFVLEASLASRAEVALAMVAGALA